MKKFLVGIVILVILCIGGYFLFGQSGLTYKGENENWEVEYRPNMKHSINLKYKGSDLSSVGEFQFAIQTKFGKWGQSIIELDENGLYTSSSSSIRKGTLTKKDKPVLTISWNDNKNKEEIILESK